MNVLPLEVRARVISVLCEGTSLRATSRLTNVSRSAVIHLLLLVGEACQRLHDARVRELHSPILELDEIWSFVHVKEGHRDEFHPPDSGDQYTWVALDATAKLVVSYRVDRRATEAADAFALDLRARVLGKPQITTDGLAMYVPAIEAAFGDRVNYAQILKTYWGDEAGGASRDDVRYSRGRVVRSITRRIQGTPDEQNVSTSYIERQNLTMRMGMRRFTRLTNAFSKRLRNLRAAVALHFAYYNFCRVHQSLRVTPAMEAQLTDRVWSVAELVTAALDTPLTPGSTAPAAPTPPSTPRTTPARPPRPTEPPDPARIDAANDFRWMW